MLEWNSECRNYIESSAVIWADESLAYTSYAAEFRQPVAEHSKEYSLLKVLKTARLNRISTTCDEGIWCASTNGCSLYD